MIKRKTALIFLVGVVVGLLISPVAFFAIDSIDGWLPYTRPDLATVETVERLASKQQEPMTNKLIQLDVYRRWYVQGKNDGQEVIWGEWDQKGKPGLYLGHRRFPPNPAAMLDGGCGRLELLYDIKRAKLERFTCNPLP